MDNVVPNERGLRSVINTLVSNNYLFVPHGKSRSILTLLSEGSVVSSHVEIPDVSKDRMSIVNRHPISPLKALVLLGDISGVNTLLSVEAVCERDYAAVTDHCMGVMSKEMARLLVLGQYSLRLGDQRMFILSKYNSIYE